MYLQVWNWINDYLNYQMQYMTAVFILIHAYLVYFNIHHIIIIDWLTLTDWLTELTD